MCIRKFVEALNGLNLKELKEYIPEDVWNNVVDSIDWKKLAVSYKPNPNYSERGRKAALARWGKRDKI